MSSSFFLEIEFPFLVFIKYGKMFTSREFEDKINPNHRQDFHFLITGTSKSIRPYILEWMQIQSWCPGNEILVILDRAENNSEAVARVMKACIKHREDWNGFLDVLWFRVGVNCFQSEKSSVQVRAVPKRTVSWR